ncbi:MAG: hypothetical protein M1816_001169 [Peltula sp. TS41687]|nr:MAG: hypothetical protein M1816_001169 [Peltula sp. TS41687]
MSTTTTTTAHSLWVYNSLGRRKTQFIPLDPNGNKVTWYCCGPTVYDAGHLGHARNYVSTDILRRIMEHLGYEVEFVMNITDVDDKIILRGRQQHLFQQFKDSNPNHSDEMVLKTISAAYTAYAQKNLPRLPQPLEPGGYESARDEAYGLLLIRGTVSGEGVPGDAEAKLKMHIKVMDSATTALNAVTRDPSSMTSSDFFAATSDILLPYLDSLHGSKIPADDYSIFTRLTQHWELQFEKDLRALNCMPPTRLTRVTEYIEEIVAFVERIVSKGFAYVTSDGSVYFDIAAFEAAGNSYARLEPWNRNDRNLQADGEGALAKRNTEKKSDSDFAVWKASKPGEPSWESPWGRGRPGWHIECSVMASAVLGSRIDIHSGGIDLAFPHHDNEIAQAEAYWVQSSPTEGCGHSHQPHDWINYFLHMGHLSIKGSKMSKSLKNFTTIEEAMKPDGGWTARRLRIVFLLGGWRESIEITNDVVKAAESWEATVNRTQKFFTNVRAYMAEEAEVKKSGRLLPQIFKDAERELRNDLDTARLKFEKALRDSFNTPLAMSIIDEMITKTNIYISQQKSSFSLDSVKEVARWVTRMVQMFGLDPSISGPDGGGAIGWSQSTSSTPNQTSSSGLSASAPVEFHREVSRFRDGVRLAALSAPTEIKKELLKLSDQVRDHAFVNEGVYLDDRDGGQPALIKYIPREELMAAREQKLAEQATQERRREAARVEREKAEREKLEQGRLSHLDMFRTEEFSAWDEEGIPIRDGQGEEIAKSRSRKLRKDWERQKRKHEAWLAVVGQGQGPGERQGEA